LPPEHFVPAASLTQTTFLACEHIPTSAPSGEQIDCPGVEQELVEAPVEAVFEDAPEPETLLSGEGAGDATTGATAEEGAGADIAEEVDAPDWDLPDDALGRLSGAPEFEVEPDPGDAEPEPEPGLEEAEPEEAGAEEPEPEEAEPEPEPEPEPEGEPEEVEPEAELAPDPEDPEPDAEPALDEPPEALQLPTGATPLNPELVSTDCPGSGNCTSPPSAVVHPVQIFATNNDGNDAAARSDIFELKKSSYSLRGISLLPDPPVTLTDAQFIYISRLPTLLNHVQANV